jgi:Putative adhesin
MNFDTLNRANRQEVIMKPRLMLFSLALALAQAPLYAATPIKPVAKPLDARGTVEVSNVRGSIKVTGWERNAVAVAGSLGADTRLVFEGSASRVVVRAERISEGKGWFGWGGSGPNEDTLLQVFVPFAASLEVEGVSADIRILGIKSSESLSAESVSGDVNVQAHTDRLDISSVSGDAEFSGRAERVDAETVSGDLRLSGIDGEISTDTVSGRVEIVASKLSKINAGSVSGDMEFDAELIGNANVSIEAMSGEITLSLPASLSATVNAETFSGSLHSDFPVKVIDEDGPGSQMRGKLGSGDARIELESFSGDIELRKR